MLLCLSVSLFFFPNTICLLSGLSRYLYTCSLYILCLLSCVVGLQVLSGTNMYGIIRAPRAGSTESIVLAVAWQTADGQLNSAAVVAAISMMAHFKSERSSAL